MINEVDGLNEATVVFMLRALYELQERLEDDHKNLLALYQKWDWLKMVIEHQQGLDETDEFTINGDYLEPFVAVVETLDELKLQCGHISNYLGDEIQNIKIPDENYSFLYIPKGKPIITTHDYGSGQFTLPGDRCHVFKIYLKDENGDPDLV